MNNIMIVLEGGLITEVRSDQPWADTNLLVVDHDDDAYPDDGTMELPSGPIVWVSQPWVGDLDMDEPDTKAIFGSFDPEAGTYKYTDAFGIERWEKAGKQDEA